MDKKNLEEKLDKFELDSKFTNQDWLTLANSPTFENFVVEQFPKLYKKAYELKDKVEKLENLGEVNEMLLDQICDDIAKLNKKVFSYPPADNVEIVGFQQRKKDTSKNVGKRGKSYNYQTIYKLKKEGFTNAKIAEILSCSVSTVKRAIKAQKS